MIRFLSILVIVLSFHIPFFSQIQIGMNQSIVKTGLIPVSEDAYSKFKKTKTILVLNKELIPYKNDIINLVSQIWNITPLVVDSLQNLKKYKLMDEYSFISLNASIIQSNKIPQLLTSHDINLTWDLWMYGDKGEDYEIMLTKIPCLFRSADVDNILMKILRSNSSISYEEIIQKLKESKLGLDLFFPPFTYFYFEKIQKNLAPNASEYFFNNIVNNEELSKLNKNATLLIESSTCFYIFSKLYFPTYTEIQDMDKTFIKNYYNKPFSLKNQAELIQSYYSDEEFYLFHYGYYNKYIYYYILNGKKNEIIYFKSIEDDVKICVPRVEVLEILSKDIKKSQKRK